MEPTGRAQHDEHTAVTADFGLLFEACNSSHQLGAPYTRITDTPISDIRQRYPVPRIAHREHRLKTGAQPA
jgi:hypothetical protein